MIPIFQLLFFKNVNIFSVLNSLSIYFIILNFTTISRFYRDNISIIFIQSFTVSLVVVMYIICHLYIATFEGLDFDRKINTFFINSSQLAIYLACFLLVLFYQYEIQKHRKFLKIAIILSIIIISFFLLKTGARSVFISLFFLTFFSKSFIKEVFRNRIYKIIGIVFTFIILIALYFLKSGSANGRLLIWLTSIKMFKSNWLFGVGINNFSNKYLLYQSEVLNNDLFKKLLAYYADETRSSFNDILQAFCEKGILGGIALLSIFSLVISNILKKRKVSNKNSNVILGKIILIIIFSSFFSYPLQITSTSLLFWTALSVFNSGNFKQYTLFLNCTLVIKCLRIFISILFLSVGVSRYYAYTRWYKLENQMALNSMNSLTELEPLLFDNSKFLMKLSKLYQAQNNFALSIQYAERSIALTPNREYYYRLGDLYEIIGLYRQAERTYNVIDLAIPHLLKPKYKKCILYFNVDCEKFRSYSGMVISFSSKIENNRTLSMKNELRSKILILGK
ncbi:O-antigen ligase family protein [Sphingobacterium sp.]|uniref:O-antigen ligase family protein n=1 Tax=Sphingobacterium sp. TaxID=341027 RepID=UPI0028989E20|nr:Wzy polymerase domain-containing protein [Sphingobacterium sp.]